MCTFSQIYWMSHFWDSQEPKNIVNFTSYLHESWCFSSPQPRVARPPSETQPLCDGMKSFLAARWARITGPTVSVRNRSFLFLGLMIYIYLSIYLSIYMYIYETNFKIVQTGIGIQVVGVEGGETGASMKQNPGQLGLSPNRAPTLCCLLVIINFHKIYGGNSTKSGKTKLSPWEWCNVSSWGQRIAKCLQELTLMMRHSHLPCG